MVNKRGCLKGGGGGSKNRGQDVDRETNETPSMKAETAQTQRTEPEFSESEDERQGRVWKGKRRRIEVANREQR